MAKYILRTLTWSCLICLPVMGVAQSRHFIPLPNQIPHLFLNFYLIEASLQVFPSDRCGHLSERFLGDESQRLDVTPVTDEQGNHHRTYRLRGNLTPWRGGISPRTHIGLDRRTPTSIHIEQAEGTLDIRPGGLQIAEIEIHLVRGDISLSYDVANAQQMGKLDLRSGHGTISLSRAEMARAEMISVAADMGDIELELGSGDHAGGMVIIQQGVGTCRLTIHPDHPVRLVIKNNLPARSELEQGFKRLADGSYINGAGARAQAASGAVTQIAFSGQIGTLEVRESP